MGSTFVAALADGAGDEAQAVHENSRIDDRNNFGFIADSGNDNAARRRRFGASGTRSLQTYLSWPSIQSTVALTCSSVSAGLPPRAGITPPSGPV